MRNQFRNLQCPGIFGAQESGICCTDNLLDEGDGLFLLLGKTGANGQIVGGMRAGETDTGYCKVCLSVVFNNEGLYYVKACIYTAKVCSVSG